MVKLYHPESCGVCGLLHTHTQPIAPAMCGSCCTPQFGRVVALVPPLPSLHFSCVYAVAALMRHERKDAMFSLHCGQQRRDDNTRERFSRRLPRATSLALSLTHREASESPSLLSLTSNNIITNSSRAARFDSVFLLAPLGTGPTRTHIWICVPQVAVVLYATHCLAHASAPPRAVGRRATYVHPAPVCRPTCARVSQEKITQRKSHQHHPHTLICFRAK